jgi:hypothetical protein
MYTGGVHKDALKGYGMKKSLKGFLSGTFSSPKLKTNSGKQRKYLHPL